MEIMKAADVIKEKLDGLTIREHANAFGITKEAEAEFYYQRFLDITTTEVMRILCTQTLYDDKLDEKDEDLLKACEFARSKLNEIMRLRELKQKG